MTVRRAVMFTVLVLLTAGSSLAVDSDAVARANAQIARGDVDLKKSNYTEAEKRYRKAAEIAPEIPSAYLGLGASLVGQRRYDEALEVLAEAESLYVEYDRLAEESSRLAIASMEDTERKVETLTETYKVDQHGPSNQLLSTRQVAELNFSGESSIPAHLYYLQGVASLRTGQKVAGIEQLQHCLEIDRTHGLAHYNLAVALLSINRIEEAADHLEKATTEGVEPPQQLVAEIDARSRERALAGASHPAAGQKVD
jgi:tetratricopeptide (TPR) repeat protein